jgi:hypothetical protein
VSWTVRAQVNFSKKTSPVRNNLRYFGCRLRIEIDGLMHVRINQLDKLVSP